MYLFTARGFCEAKVVLYCRIYGPREDLHRYDAGRPNQAQAVQASTAGSRGADSVASVSAIVEVLVKNAEFEDLLDHFQAS